MAHENKLGLTSSADLDREEERISKKKAVELFETGLLDTLPAGKFVTLQEIHKHLFDDIYDFAGEIRTVNMAKGNFRFFIKALAFLSKPVSLIFSILSSNIPAFI